MTEASAETEGLPEDCAAQEAALNKQSLASLKNMLRQVDLPICGSKGELVVRLIRHLQGLPPTAADARLYDYMDKQAEKRKKKIVGTSRGSAPTAPDPAASAQAGADVALRKAAEEVARKTAEEAARKAAEEAEAAAAAKAQEYADKKRLKKEKKAKKHEAREKAVAAAAAVLATEPAKTTELMESQTEADGAATAAPLSCEPSPKKLKVEATTPASTVAAPDVAAPLAISGGEVGPPPAADAMVDCTELALAEEPAPNDVSVPEPDISDEEMEGEGEPGALIVDLEGVAASRLQAGGGRWKRHYEAVTGASLEVSVDPKAGESSQVLRTGLAVTVSGLRKRPLRQFNGRLGRIVGAEDDGSWHVRLACGGQERVPSANLTPRAAGFWGEVWLRTPLEESTRAGVSSSTTGVGADPAKRLLAALTEEDDSEQPFLQRLHALLASIQCKSLSVSAVPCAGEGVTVLRVPAPAVRHLRALGAKALMSEFRVVAAVLDLESSEAKAPPMRASTSGSEQLKSLLANLGAGQLVEAHNGSERWREAVVLGPNPEDSNEFRLRWCLDGVEEKISKRHIRVPSPVNDDAWLAIYGNARGRRGAELKAMAAAERAAPGFFSSEPPPSDAGPDDPLGILRVPLTAPGGAPFQDSIARRAIGVASASGAIVQLVGPDALVCGSSTQRLAAAALLGVARSASQEAEVSEVPDKLHGCCARVRVPQAAWKVATMLPTIEKENGVTGLWVEPSESQDEEEPEDDQELVLRRGMPVNVRCPEGTFEAVVVSTEEDEGTVVVQWPEDGSKTRLLAHRVRPKAEEANKQAKKNRAWLRKPWVLALFGPPRQRKTAALSVMQACDGFCPGLWSTEVVDVLDEMRGDPNEDCGISIEAKPLVGEGTDPLLATLTDKKGRLLIRRASVASCCGMQTLGNKAKTSGLFFVGTGDERRRGLEYLRWVVAEERALAEQLTTSSAADEDWDEADSKPSAMALAQEFMEARKSRDDVCCVPSTSGITCWLEPAHVREIERETNTLVLVDHGCAPDEWRATAAASVHVCGPDGERRHAARALVEAKLAEIATQVEEDQKVEETAAEAKGGEPAKKKARRDTHDKQPSWDGGKVMGAGKLAEPNKAATSAPTAGTGADGNGRQDAAAPTSVAVPIATGPLQPSPESAVAPAVVLQPTNPLMELRKLPSWPLDTAAWAQVQDTVWANHAQLAKGWIRIWSRSKDTEYYFRMQDGKTTFKLREAMAQ